MTGSVRIDVDGLLLDCDGVLVDSHDAAAIAWNRWATHWAPGFDFHRDIEHGRRISDLVAELIGDTSQVEVAAAELKQLELDTATDVRPIPGARELLAACPPGRWAVVTSGNRALATARMASAGLPPAPVLVTGEDVDNGKPFPDPYLLAAQRLQIPPERCAVFEDAPAGIASAREAGVPTIVGVGAAAAPVTLAVADLRAVRFDGARLEIARDALLPQTGE
ncbi:sugar-phosphatase [Mycolicibacterium rutilum]|uniref:Sugar-phosphatase n=1 Tax=Mycolicibacterium rutilum TaxID=370526 RepID=A0A1H6LGK0_MYCRU|nr:HAD-IA family hydrolase [Mycolicibacterium rutilum]SEH85187.1 sugar-phosphatase [Mycolicibacterium rutilum]